MAVFNFTVPIYGFDQWTAAASTNNTVSYTNGTTFTLNSNAALTVIDVQDDDGNAVGSPDNTFDDGFIDTPADGSTPSTANNDQVLTQAVTINGQTFQAGDQVELEFAFTTTTGETFWIIRIDGQNVGISGATLPQPGTTYEVASSADSQFSPVSDVPCFTDGAMVLTPQGPVAIERLKAGDLVTTRDNGAQPIVWTGKREVSSLDILFFPELRPIEFAAHAFGKDEPSCAFLLSPNHRVLARSYLAEMYFAELEVLIAAKHLVNGTSIKLVRPSEAFSYRHLLLENHEVLSVNGVLCESLYPGVGAVPAEDLLEIDLHGDLQDTSIPFARPVLRKFEALLLKDQLSLH